MQELTDEQKVKAKWPRATCSTPGLFRNMLAIYERPCNEEIEPFWGKILSSTFHETEEAAWADAAEFTRQRDEAIKYVRGDIEFMRKIMDHAHVMSDLSGFHAERILARLEYALDELTKGWRG